MSTLLDASRTKKSLEVNVPKTITCSKDAYHYFIDVLTDLTHEEFWILLLNQGNKIIGKNKISEGGISVTTADPRKIFKAAIEKLASGIILCHNHPSGNIKPSDADIKLTRKLCDAARLIDLQITDHIIFCETTNFSFRDEGLLG